MAQASQADTSPLGDLPSPKPVSDYEKIKRIGEGTYGVVYAAKHRKTGQVVALKKLRMERERDGMPVTSVREVRVLQACQHVNLVHLIKVVTGPKLDSVFLVFEFVEHDVGRLLDVAGVRFTTAEVKCLLHQLLRAVAYLHNRWILHRDLKMSNILLTHRGVLKLCDFGLARYFKPEDAAYTPRVVTLWYRAPELLLGASRYTEAVDMWSVGCVMAELLRGSPLFPGTSEAELLGMLFNLLGTPSSRIWPVLGPHLVDVLLHPHLFDVSAEGFDRLPHASKIALPDQPYSFLRKEFPQLSHAGHDLLSQLLTYDPEQRISASAALRHRWFAEPPFPLDCAAMPQFTSLSLDGGDDRRRPDGLRQEDGKRRHESGMDCGFGKAFDTAAGRPPKRQAR